MSDKIQNGETEDQAEARSRSVDIIIINQPMVRDFSTGGGHRPGDTLVEGDEKIVTRKWQGYPPENLNLIGKPHPAMPEVGIPRLHGQGDVRHARSICPTCFM